MNYIIFDLESTCWDNNNPDKKQSEVIEIGAVMIDDNLKIINQFNRFVKPIINPTLSQFCKNLTHIQQTDVDAANKFEVVMKEFAEWCIKNGDNVILCSWGFYDKSQIKREASVKYFKGKILSLLNNHISIKHQFGEINNIKPCGTQKALSICGYSFIGTQHRAIDDSKNISRIFLKIFNDLKF